MELKRKLDNKTDELKLAEERYQKAAESGQISDEKIADIVMQLGLANAEKDELEKSNCEKDKLIRDLSEKVAAMQNRVKSAEQRADEAEKEKAELEVESGELRERAQTLDSELHKVKAEASIKITEYKRSASHGQDTSNEIYARQLAEREAELDTIQVRYANLSEELQISRHRTEEAAADAEAAQTKLTVEIDSLKESNGKLQKQLEEIKQAAVNEGNVDAVLRQQLDLAQEEIEKYRNAAVEQQQEKADEKARKRHVETNTPEMDVAMIKSLSAQIKNKDIDLDLAKDALYRSDNNTSELIAEVNKLTTQNSKLEKLCRKLNKKLRASERAVQESKQSQMSQSKSTPLLDLDRDGGASVSGSIMSNEDSEEMEKLSYYGDVAPPNMVSRQISHGLPRQGVVKFAAGDLSSVVDAIIANATKIESPRAGAAYLLFMTLRHTDNTNDDNQLKNLLVATINGLKRMGKRNERTVPGITMWTMIAVRLTHLIFQYSGEPEACTLNSADQNAHILKNFDLNEFRVVFNDTSVTLYRKMITIMQDKLKPMVVSAMLDHDSLHGSSSGKSIEDLMRELGANLDLAKEYGCDDIVLRQVLRQLIYFVVSISLNQLLVRRDLCNWTKAMQLRYNVSQIEEFFSRRNMRNSDIIKELSPLVQASQLMQVKKQDEKDATALLTMCDSLTGAQVLKLLQLITPQHEYEEVVPAKFLQLVKQKTSRNPGIQQRDVGHIFAPEFPYVPSEVLLTELELPHGVKQFAQIV